MDGGGGHQGGVVLLVVAVQVGGVLEVVGVQLSVSQSTVGHDIIVIGDDLQGVALVCQGLLHLLQDLSVGCGAGTDTDGLVVCLLAAGSHGGEGQKQGQNEDQ